MIINGVPWKIRFVHSNSHNLMRNDGSITLGVTDNNDGYIYLSKALKGSLLEHVLIHEITHACIFSYGIYITLEEEERLCEFVAIHGKEILSYSDYILHIFQKVI